MEIFRQTSLAYGNLARTIRAHVGVRKVFEILMGHAQRWRPRSADDHLIPDIQGVAVGTAGYVGNARHQDVRRKGVAQGSYFARNRFIDTATGRRHPVFGLHQF